ncbi:MAG: aldehyde dehydrogenase family protein [Solirubrobacterales bacterium]|nr:aldehyde dehydrogenase family protein [Solirubrobacterales bacterium]
MSGRDEAPALPPFRNEPVLELRRAAERESLRASLAELDARLPLAVPVWVGDDHRTGEDFASTDPGEPERRVAVAAEASAADVDAAVARAAEAQRHWGRRPAAERAKVLVAAAAVLRRRRLELAALEVRECAKPWPEADADVCEAIDFLEYYAREAIRLERGPTLDQARGERNTMRYVAAGVVAVIAPWNFPLAIPTGMTAAALAAGNAAVLKPAEQSPATALALVEALHEAGLPAGTIALLPGHGEVGAALVEHPGVHVIAFTGSSAVGREIVRVAARTPDGQAHVKRVVAEMGGKNPLIVDDDADLDQAVPAAVAFVYAGQKCSAASRVLVHESIADTLAERLAGMVELLRVGPAAELETDVPPVIEREARERILAYVELAAGDGRSLATAPVPTGPGWFCAPTLVGDLDPSSRVLREEVFGPLLALERVPSVEAACERIEALPFALTGALFARNPETVAAVAERSPVGNLYVNRHTTGAMVGRQPFGGNRLSGTGASAGGPDYLLQFLEPRVITEDTTRQGLVVD